MRTFRFSAYLGILLSLCAVPFLNARGGSQSQEQAQPPIVEVESGRSITEHDAKVLEEGLVKNPENLVAREKLLGYYSNPPDSPEIEKKREAQIFWLIEHHPEADVSGLGEAWIMPDSSHGSVDAYQHAKELWLQQVEKHASDVHVILNASQFFLLPDHEETSELLQKALEIAPTNVEVPSNEAQYYELERSGARSDEKRKELSEKALAFRERALPSTGADERVYAIEEMATDALEAGDLARAEQYANELLKDAQDDKSGWNYGNEIHKGNVVLGRVALRRGDVEGAKQHLLAAGDVSGSPQLDSFGPNMTLAKELLEKGERETVIAYLQACAKFWKMGREDVQNWIATIKGGGTPEFGGNLSY